VRSGFPKRSCAHQKPRSARFARAGNTWPRPRGFAFCGLCNPRKELKGEEEGFILLTCFYFIADARFWRHVFWRRLPLSVLTSVVLTSEAFVSWPYFAHRRSAGADGPHSRHHRGRRWSRPGHQDPRGEDVKVLMKHNVRGFGVVTTSLSRSRRVLFR